MKFVPNAVTVKAARTVLLSKKHSPQILFAGGVVTGVATVVTACRATLKVEELLEETQKDIALVKEMVHTDYSEEDRKKDLALVYFRASTKFVKLYGPSFVLGVTSVAMLTSAHNIQSRRIAGLTASYAAVEKAFDQYRGRVRAELGDEKDREFRYGKEVVEEKQETASGTKTVKKPAFGVDGVSGYAKLFSKDTSSSWGPVPESNLFFLRSAQNYVNDRLKARGHVFLNEVYDELGLERTQAGAVVGWVWDPYNNIEGDNEIDFGIWEANDLKQVHDFMTGIEGAILLDFNVDGVIYDKI